MKITLTKKERQTLKKRGLSDADIRKAIRYCEMLAREEAVEQLSNLIAERMLSNRRVHF